MAECVEVSSEGYSSDTSSTPTTPPPKHKKSATKKTRQGRGKHRKVKHKTRRRKILSRRKRKYVSSSSSSESQMSELSDSDQVPKRKKSKLGASKMKSTARNRSISEYDIFQKHYSRLVEMTSSCVSTITNKLFSRKLISREALGKVITRYDSDQEKAQQVLLRVEQQIKDDPRKLRALVDVCREEPVFDDITKKIMSEIQLVDQEEQKVDTTREYSSLSRYKAYLNEIYHQDLITCDDKLSIIPCSNFVKLALVNKEKHTRKMDTFSNSTLHGGVDEILASKTPLEMDALVTPDSKFVLVEGPAGIGKSTLSSELCRKWDTLKSLQDFKIVLLLKLRERRVQNATTLHELFFHEDKQLCEDVVKYVLSCSGEGVLLVMDGFDEMPTTSSLVMRLIKGECLPKATRLVTSRPSVLHLKNRCFPHKYRHVEILGFTDEYKRQFADETFKTEPEILVRFKKFIFSNPIITSLMYIPVNCAIIAQVYKELPDITVPKTMTQLYTLLVLILIKRHLIQTGRWRVESKVPTKLEDLPEDIKADLMQVGKLALKGLVQRVATFTDEEVGDSFQHLGLFNESKEMYISRGAVTYYSFLHLSVQEFLAAWYSSLCPDFLTKDSRSCESYSKVFEMFLSGMWSLNLRHIQNWRNIMLLVSCCYEAQDVSCLELLKTKKAVTIYIHISNPLDMYMFGYALVNASIKWCIYNTSTSYSMLASSISDHAPDGKLQGSIVRLRSTRNVIALETIPESLLESIIAMPLTNDTTPAISYLPNLQEITLDHDHNPRQLTTQTIKMVKNIKRLKTITIMTSIPSMQALCSILASSTTLENVIVEYFSSRVESGKNLWQIQNLINSALACSTLQYLETITPFYCLSNSNSLRALNLDVKGHFTIHSIVTCMHSIAYMCRSHKLLTSVKIMLYPPIPFHTYAAQFNSSLHSNPSLRLQAVFHFSLSQLSFLSCALRKDPVIINRNLRRSKSLYDLTTLKVMSSEGCQKSTPWKCDITPIRWRWYNSCPDLLEMQSLHNMHPQLHQALRTNKLYYTENKN